MRLESHVLYQPQRTGHLSDDMNIQAGLGTDIELGSFTTLTLTQEQGRRQVRLLDITNP